MKKTLERCSQCAFRISAFAVVGLLVVLTAREQNRPEATEIQDTRYLQSMESYVKVEKLREAQAKQVMADDQTGHRATSHGVRSPRPTAASVRS